MAIKKVLKMGDPMLYRKAEPVDLAERSALDSLIKDMFDTMVALNGAGLAAPQIGVSTEWYASCHLYFARGTPAGPQCSPRVI